MIHPLSNVQTTNIGEDTTIWQYAVVLSGAQIGANCNINCHTFIENKVVLGDNVTVKSGVYLWDGITLGNNVFIGPAAVFTNDINPRSKQFKSAVQTKVDDFASIGANAVIRAGITIGKYAMIGMGAVVTKSVPAYALVYGNPARINGYVDEEGQPMEKINGNKWKAQNGTIFIASKNGLKKI